MIQQQNITKSNYEINLDIGLMGHHYNGKRSKSMPPPNMCIYRDIRPNARIIQTDLDTCYLTG